MHPLDIPVWSALNTYLAPLASGNDRALRFAPQINLFAACRSDSPADLQALADLFAPGETMLTLQAHQMPPVPGMVLQRAGQCVQMLAQDVPQVDSSLPMYALGAADAADMLALAELTEPGPFLPQTWRIGQFYGVRLDGRLAAMAGMRHHFPGYCEVSGVCVHPDLRGQGLARMLSAKVAAQILARGEQPFLHAWEDNQAAQALYHSLGFHIRGKMWASALRKAD
ncbi:GNAT family N-acetyltransferase [Massilia sp. W12]|uniref:GNAT family N-acetyltransferase n=1 Tax=Massilia sp. W12 TaxID=3126507 RepID=UPI0030CAB1B6